MPKICYAKNMTWYWKALIIAVVLVVGGATQFLLTRDGERAPVSATSATSTAGIIAPSPDIVDPTGGGYEVRPLPLPKTETPTLKAPDIEKLIAEITPKDDYEKIVYGNLTKSAAALKVDAGDYDAWLTVGMSLKQLERFPDARDALVYLSSVWPEQDVPHGNLGSLYHLYLKDFLKSEAAYKKAIALDQTQPSWHRGLYELYRYSYKQNTNAWEGALKEGIEATNSIDLMAVLAGRYADLKRFVEAVVLYDRAIAAAEKGENATALVDRLIAARAAARAEIK